MNQIKSTTSTIRHLQQILGDSVDNDEFNEIISQIQSDAIERVATLYQNQYFLFKDEKDNYVSESSRKVAEMVKTGTYVMTPGSWMVTVSE